AEHGPLWGGLCPVSKGYGAAQQRPQRCRSQLSRSREHSLIEVHLTAVVHPTPLSFPNLWKFAIRIPSALGRKRLPNPDRSAARLASARNQVPAHQCPTRSSHASGPLRLERHG